jgi:hypothetical protein
VIVLDHFLVAEAREPWASSAHGDAELRDGDFKCGLFIGRKTIPMRRPWYRQCLYIMRAIRRPRKQVKPVFPQPCSSPTIGEFNLVRCAEFAFRGRAGLARGAGAIERVSLDFGQVLRAT